MSYAVSDQERAALTALQADGEAPEVRRAQIILLSADGLRTAEIAETVDLSVSQVQYWRREWRKNRMAVFPDYDPDDEAGTQGDAGEGQPQVMSAEPETRIFPDGWKSTYSI